MRALGIGVVGILLGLLFIGTTAGVTAAEVETGLRERLVAAGSGDYLVLLRAHAPLADLRQLSDRELRARTAYQRLRSTASASQAELVALLAERCATDVTSFRAHFAVNAISVTSGVATLDLLTERPEVAKLVATRSTTLPLGDGAVAPAVGRAVGWNVNRVGGPAMWSLGHTGAGVVVATMDTGVRYTHTTLVGAYRGNLGGGTFDHDFAWYDPAGICPGAEPCDNFGLGTGITSLLVGNDGADNQVGVAPGARWITAKGCESGSCSDASILAAADWLLAPCPIGAEPGDATCDPAQRPDVIAVTWQRPSGGDDWFRDAVDAWEAAGIMPFAKAGNSGPAAGTVVSPADYCDVVAVGVVDSADAVPSYSGRGPGDFPCSDKPDLVAPGAGVRVASITNDTSFTTVSGSAYSAAHAAGCAALLLSAAPQLGFAEVAALLSEGADDLAPAGFDYASGHGVVRADSALARLADLVLVDGFENGGTRAWSVRHPAAGNLYLFDGGGTMWAIGGRDGADAMCAAAVSSYPGVPATHVHALLGVSAVDEIRDMPSLYDVPTDRPVLGPTGTVVAEDWSDLLDGSVDTSLQSAGVLTGVPYWYTGSTVFGTIVVKGCSGWTNDGAIFDGRYGTRNGTSTDWIAAGDATCGLETYHVLCLAWE